MLVPGMILKKAMKGELPFLAAAKAVAESLAAESLSVDMLVVPAGEPTKSIEMAASLWQQML